MTNKIPTSNPDDFCKKVKASGKTQYFGAGHGLRLRVTPKGAKVWIYNYNAKTTDGYKTRSYTIGNFKETSTQADGFSVAGARRELLRLKSIIADGGDPAAEKQKKVQQRLAEEAAIITVQELYDIWFEAEPIKRKDKGAEVARMMHKDVLPAIGSFDANVITKPHIQRIMRPIEKRGERIAGVVFSLLRQFFGWAEDRGYIQNDPAARFRKKIGSAGKERERYLSKREVTDLFHRLPFSGLSETQQIALKIQLGTGCRIGELIKARWEHIDIDEASWTIPSENSKNAKAHTIHLSQWSLPLIEQLLDITSGSEWLFPASRGPGHACTKSITKAVADRQKEPDETLKGRTIKQAQALMLEGGQWRPHDLRRTASTFLGDLRVLPDIIERILNHKEENKMKRIYQRYDYFAERKEALERLGGLLIELQNTRFLLPDSPPDLRR